MYLYGFAGPEKQLEGHKYSNSSGYSIYLNYIFVSSGLLQVERAAQLKTQLLDSEATVRKLNVQVEELKLQLKQTQAGLCLIPKKSFMKFTYLTRIRTSRCLQELELH